MLREHLSVRRRIRLGMSNSLHSPPITTLPTLDTNRPSGSGIVRAISHFFSTSFEAFHTMAEASREPEMMVFWDAACRDRTWKGCQYTERDEGGGLVATYILRVARERG
jgi:hypothetical protein